MKRMIIGGVAAFAALAAQAATAPPTVQPAPAPNLANPKQTYDTCVLLSKQKPEQAYEMAGKWIDATGPQGADAAHECKALALIALKDYAAAARGLEDAADASKGPTPVRADMFEQAGQAWILAGDPTHAYQAQTAGLAVAPDGSPQKVLLLVDRAGALAEGAKYKEAITDLDAALAIQPDNGDALAFRASAYRHLKDLDRAFADADHAVKADANNGNALLERANIYKLQGKLNQARLDWVAAIQLAPESDVAAAARKNIEETDITPDAPAPAKKP